MEKKDFDLASLSKRLKLDGLVDNVKSIISPTSITIDAAEGDQVGALLAHLNELVHTCALEHEKQEQRLGQIAKTSANIYALLQAQASAKATTEPTDDQAVSSSATTSDVSEQSSDQVAPDTASSADADNKKSD